MFVSLTALPEVQLPLRPCGKGESDSQASSSGLERVGKRKGAKALAGQLPPFPAASSVVLLDGFALSAI